MVSAIEEKKKTKIDTKKERTTNDWGKFVKSIFHNLVTTLLIVLLVCNSIFYSQMIEGLEACVNGKPIRVIE